MFHKKLMQLLEFDTVLGRLSECAVSDPGRLALQNLIPADSFPEVRRQQAYTAEAYAVLYKYLLSPVVQFDDVSEILEKAEAGAMLQMGELLKAAKLMRSARIAKKEITGTGDDIVELKRPVSAIFVDGDLEKEIGGAIAGENEMRDDASDALRTLRRKILAANNKLKEKLAGYTRSGEYSKYLQDNLVTIRMGRFVLPVKSECRSQVPGLIHDQSSSGSTVFIEPFQVVELNNELKLLQLEEQQEIERILRNLSAGVAAQYENLKFALEQCVFLDVVFAKCKYSVIIKGTVPILNDRGAIDLKRARHPLIDESKIVPVDVRVGRDCKMLMVTGPNTGGKTVCLKTVGLCCLMAFAGLWLPCEEKSEISVFDRIFCDLGDEQSIEQSLSTFSAHIVNIIEITNEITPHSLVLMDELGAGTDPAEGAALSIGIIRYMELIGCVGIITTHFSELKEYALISPNLMNACMQFDEETLRPTYKLIIGIPGVSNALEIARSLGLNDFILEKAHESMHEEKLRFEEVLKNAERAKSEAIKESEAFAADRVALNRERDEVKRQHDLLTERLERIHANAQAETRRVMRNMLEQADELMRELKDTLKEGDEQALRQARGLYNRLEAVGRTQEEDIPRLSYEPLDPGDVKIGQKVIVKSLNLEGTVRSLPDKKNEVLIQAGNMRMNADANDLGRSVPPVRPVLRPSIKEPAAQKADRREDAPAAQTQEIKLLGLTVSEAIEALEPYILAAQGCNKTLRIVHGKGTGALGRGIQDYLRRHPLVASYRYGRYGEGDTGVTLAEIK